MHVETKRTSIHSLKEFGKEFLMIVVGISTALALEHVVTTRHHARAAEESRQQIVEELRTNLEGVEGSLKENEAASRSMSEFANFLAAEIKAGFPKAKIDSHVKEFWERHPITVGIYSPTLRHEAWDVVVANQTAIYMAPEALRRYSASYAEMRDTATSCQILASAGIQMQLIKAMVDHEMERGDPMDFLYAIKAFISGNIQAKGALLALKGQLESSLAAEPKTADGPRAGAKR